MPRDVTLAKLLEDLAHECGDSTNPNSRTHVRSTFTRMLARNQEQLYETYDWPHLRVWRDVDLQAGQKTYDFPSDLDAGRVEAAYTRYGRQWFPMIRSLEPFHYDEFDSDEDERFNPQMRWHLRDEAQFEVWPIPSDNDQVLRFVGTKKLDPLVDDADTCDLDSNLLVLFSAAQILRRRKAADADLMATQAQQHLSKIRARLDSREGFNFLGNEERDTRRPFGPKPVDYS